MNQVDIRQAQDGRLIFRPALSTRLLVLGAGLVTLVLYATVLLPVMLAQSGLVNLIIGLISLGLFYLVVQVGFKSAMTIIFDPNLRQIFFLTPSLLFFTKTCNAPFTELDNIELMRSTKQNSSGDKYKLDFKFNVDRKMRFDWGGTRDEMIALGKKIAGLTGKPLTEHVNSD